VQHFIGTKVLQAAPMTRGEYNSYREWTPPEGEEQDVAGYLVTYSDGYESWSPKEQFDEAYVALPEGVDAEETLRVVRHKTNLLLGVQ
jgi:hypothetical protein